MPIWFPHCPTWSVMISLGILFSFPLSLGQLTRVSDRKGKGKAKKTEAGILLPLPLFRSGAGRFLKGEEMRGKLGGNVGK
jgi:hypothetical protein